MIPKSWLKEEGIASAKGFLEYMFSTGRVWDTDKPKPQDFIGDKQVTKHILPSKTSADSLWSSPWIVRTPYENGVELYGDASSALVIFSDRNLVNLLQDPNYKIRDFKQMWRGHSENDTRPRHFFDLFVLERSDGSLFGVTSSRIGPSNAATTLEGLTDLGFSSVISAGMAGHPTDKGEPLLDKDDIVIVTEALCYESVSWTYGATNSFQPPLEYRGSVSIPNSPSLDGAREALAKKGLEYVEGSVATVAAIYREVPSMIAEIVDKGAVAIDMETSTLFSASRHCDVSMTTMLYISDIVRSHPDLTGYQSQKNKQSWDADLAGMQSKDKGLSLIETAIDLV